MITAVASVMGRSVGEVDSASPAGWSNGKIPAFGAERSGFKSRPRSCVDPDFRLSLDGGRQLAEGGGDEWVDGEGVGVGGGDEAALGAQEADLTSELGRGGGDGGAVLLAG